MTNLEIAVVVLLIGVVVVALVGLADAIAERRRRQREFYDAPRGFYRPAARPSPLAVDDVVAPPRPHHRRLCSCGRGTFDSRYRAVCPYCLADVRATLPSGRDGVGVRLEVTTHEDAKPVYLERREPQRVEYSATLGDLVGTITLQAPAPDYPTVGDVAPVDPGPGDSCPADPGPSTFDGGGGDSGGAGGGTDW